MKIEDLNQVLRIVISDLLTYYSRRKIVNITLGGANYVMFERFYKDQKDLGIKPLRRILDSLGYELHLIPVPKGDNEIKKQVEELSRPFTETIFDMMVQVLDSMDESGNSERVVTKLFEKSAKELLENLNKN